jgi:hypothetical protein
MAGCDTSPRNDLYESGERRVINWVLGGAAAVGLASFLDAASITGLTGGAIAIVVAAIESPPWRARCSASSLGSPCCGSRPARAKPEHDHDGRMRALRRQERGRSTVPRQRLDLHLGNPFALLNPIVAGLDVQEIRTRSAPGAGPVQLIFYSGSGKPAFHCEIGSHIGDYAAVGAAVGSVVGAAGAFAGAAICAALGLLTFGIGAALCLLIVAAMILAGAAVGGIAGDAIGGVAGWIADELSDFDERGEAVTRGCPMNLTGRWVTDAGHGHNEIHDVASAQLVECNNCDTDATGSASSGLLAAVGIGRHPTGRDP